MRKSLLLRKFLHAGNNDYSPEENTCIYDIEHSYRARDTTLRHFAHFLIPTRPRTINPVYHVEKPRPFISPPYHIWSCYGIIWGNLRDLEKSHKLPIT